MAALPALVASCVGLSWFTGNREQPAGARDEDLALLVGIVDRSEAPSAAFNHRVHIIDNNFECDDCHEATEDGVSMTMPVLGDCFDCHKAADPGKARAYLETQGWSADLEEEAREALDERPITSTPFSHHEDVVFEHGRHVKEGEPACQTCHGDVSRADSVTSAFAPNMAACVTCHEERGQGVECGACHREIRRERAPAFHQSEDWIARGVHGRAVEAGLWQDGRCDTCHEEPGSWCSDCHAKTRPASHNAQWRTRHGATFQADRDACARCHSAAPFCDRCHQREKPRSHTASWRRDAHGAAATLDSEQCETCHRQDLCARCHERTKPRNHLGGWGAPNDRHCFSCHESVADEGCLVCHRAGDVVQAHGRAPRLPTAPFNHTLVPGPENCRECHIVNPQFGAPRLRHPDNGDHCESSGCHRR